MRGPDKLCVLLCSFADVASGFRLVKKGFGCNKSTMSASQEVGNESAGQAKKSGPLEVAGHTEMKSKVLESIDRIRSSGSKEAKLQLDGKTQHSKPHYVSRSEEEVGITQYIDSSEGFTGITKHRWSDFIVHEIGVSGKIAVLTNTSVPVVKESSKQDTSRPDWFPETEWEQVATLSAADKGASPVNIPADQLSKDDRTRYHGIIKSCFPNLITNTGEVDGKKAIVVRQAGAAPDKRNTFWRHKPWPKDRPKFLHFCLYKENLDTFAGLSMLSMDLKLKSNKFLVAGTKDARAKTTQMVAVKQVTAEKLHEAASKFGKLKVGNFSYEDHPLKLGQLKGNQFDIVLRHVQGDEEVIARRMASFQEHGFINYYGLQRFGVTSSATHLVGRAIVRKEWRAAVDMLLSGREDEHGGSMAKAQRAWRTERDPRRAYALLSNKQQRTTLEGRVLHTLCSVRATAYQEAVDRLPPASRQLYVHAYQSWLWNRVVSRRLAVHGLRLRSGDLVLATGDEPEHEPAAAEDDAPPAVDDEAPTPAPALPGGPPDVRALTEAELAQHTIHELVLPLPGWAVRYPDNETADWYRELLEADGVDLSREHCDSLRQYSLAGAYRRVLARPDVGRWRIARYADPAVDLVASDVDALMGRTPPADDPSGPYRALLLQFTLPASCYATMALREITGMESSLATQMALNDAYSAEMRRLRQGRGGAGRSEAAPAAHPRAAGAEAQAAVAQVAAAEPARGGGEDSHVTPSGGVISGGEDERSEKRPLDDQMEEKSDKRLKT